MNTGAYTRYVRLGGAVTYVLIRALAAKPPVARLCTRLQPRGSVWHPLWVCVRRRGSVCAALGLCGTRRGSVWHPPWVCVRRLGRLLPASRVCHFERSAERSAVEKSLIIS